MTVSNGTATGYNKMMDYSWDNTMDWECTFDFNANSNNGAVFMDSTSSNYSSNLFTVISGTNQTYYYIDGLTGTTNWGATLLSTKRNNWVTVKVQNRSGVLSFYDASDNLITSHANISAITNICFGLYSWTNNGTGSIKNLKIKKL